MKKFLVRRAMTAVITLLAVTVLVFILARMTGDPRVLLLGDQTQTSQEQWDAWGRDFGLDKPLVVQYVIYLGKLVRGDLGDSILQRRSVTELMWQRMPNSAQLAVVAFAFSIINRDTPGHTVGGDAGERVGLYLPELRHVRTRRALILGRHRPDLHLRGGGRESASGCSTSRQTGSRRRARRRA